MCVFNRLFVFTRKLFECKPPQQTVMNGELVCYQARPHTHEYMYSHLVRLSCVNPRVSLCADCWNVHHMTGQVTTPHASHLPCNSTLHSHRPCNSRLCSHKDRNRWRNIQVNEMPSLECLLAFSGTASDLHRSGVKSISTTEENLNSCLPL